jgi:hypothetical protein
MSNKRVLIKVCGECKELIPSPEKCNDEIETCSKCKDKKIKGGD